MCDIKKKEKGTKFHIMKRKMFFRRAGGIFLLLQERKSLRINTYSEIIDKKI